MGDAMVVSPGLTPDWLRKRKGIFSALEDQLVQGLETPGTGLTLDGLQLVVEHRDPFAQLVTPAELAEVVALEKEKWEKVFPKGSLDFSDLVAFPRKAGYDWPVLVPKRITNNRLYVAAKGLFPCWRYIEDLDTIGPAQSFTTLRWFKKVQEADEDLQNLSANDLLARGTPCVWLQERIWMEIDRYKETGGGHLDKVNATLVAGSRSPHGYVPHVYWDGSKLLVDGVHPDFRLPRWRARSAG